MKYTTQIIPFIDLENGIVGTGLVTLNIIDTDKNTIEQVICLKEAADIIKQSYELKENDK